MQRSQSKIFILVLLFTLAIHGAAIYSIKDLALDFQLSGRPGWIDSTQQMSVYTAETQEIINKRNEQLKEVFQEWVQPATETPSLAFDLKNLSAEDLKTEWQALEAAVAATSAKDAPLILPEIDQGMLIEQEMLTALSQEPQARFASNEHSSAMLAFPSDSVLQETQPIIRSLTEATDQPLGIVAKFPDEQPVKGPALPMGQLELTLSSDEVWQPLPLEKPDPASEILSEADLEKAKQEVTEKVFSTLDSLPVPTLSPDAKLGFSPFSDLDGGSQDDMNHTATIASTHAFTLEVEYAKRTDGPGYLFCAKFVPKSGIAFKRIAQNYFFLVDRSHSIDPVRYEKSKAAVLKALSYLKENDTFNILIFDDKITRLAAANLPWNRQNFEKAYEFLKAQKHGGIFATTDLYTSLGNIVPDAVADIEVNTAILLSDGDTFLNKDNQRQTIGKWSRKNQGKVSLYSLAAGKGNNLALLDLLSSFNKGHLSYTADLGAIEQTLEGLMKTIQNPIGKDIVATAIVVSPETHVVLYPRPQRMPDLYEQSPFTVYGTIDNLQDFTLFLQGRYYDKWLDIKQMVSFEKAKRISSKSIERSIAAHQAYDLYDQFLKDGKPRHLSEARVLLNPYKIPVAFQ